MYAQTGVAAIFDYALALVKVGNLTRMKAHLEKCIMHGVCVIGLMSDFFINERLFPVNRKK